MKKIKCSKGFTLIELLVSIAILVVLSSIFITSYLGVLEDKRCEADLTTLGTIDDNLKQILLYKDAFEEVKEKHIYNKDKYSIDFIVTKNKKNKKGEVIFKNAKITKGSTKGYLSDVCPVTFKYLTEQIGDELNLSSLSYTSGTYTVNVEFGGTQVSSLRQYTITNDDIRVTNTGDKNLTTGN